MNLYTRRSFARGGAAAAFAATSLIDLPLFLRKASADITSGGWTGKKLLFIFLRGGNDGLNMVVPGGDPEYYVARPSIGIPLPTGGLDPAKPGTAPVNPPADRGIDLGNNFAMLHPGLADLVPMYNAGELAVVHRVGYANQSRSHFDSQYYWENGTPRDKGNEEGLFYRTLVELGLDQSQSLPGVSYSSNMPLLLRGEVPMSNIDSPSRYDLLGVHANARAKHIAAIERMYGTLHVDKKNRQLTFPTGERFVRSIEQVQGIDFGENDAAEFIENGEHLFPIDSNSNEKDFSSSAYRFFQKLKYCCQTLSETDAVITGLNIGGFDTHNDQGGVDGGHASLMERLGWGIHAARQYLSHPNVNQWDNTLVVTMSEFGRTSEQNGSAGTDHAEAGPMLIAGGGTNHVQGGVFECDSAQANLPWVPGEDGAMFEVSGRYLSRTVDYRSIFGEIICKHLGGTAAQVDAIIPGYANPSENLRGGGVSIDGDPIQGELGILA